MTTEGDVTTFLSRKLPQTVVTDVIAHLRSWRGTDLSLYGEHEVALIAKGAAQGRYRIDWTLLGVFFDCTTSAIHGVAQSATTHQV